MKKTLSILAIIFFCSFTAGEKEITIKLSPSEVDYVLNALSEKPFKESSGLINKIYLQASKQMVDTTSKK